MLVLMCIKMMNTSYYFMHHLSFSLLFVLSFVTIFFVFSVRGAQRSPVWLSSEESEGMQTASVDELLPHPCQAAVHPAEAETLDENTELNNVEKDSNSDIFLVSSELPVAVTSPDLGNNSDVVLVSSELPAPVIAPVLGSNSDIVYVSSEHVPLPVPIPQPKRTIQVHRLNIKKDMIDLFREPLIMAQDIEIIVIDARGLEEVGRGVGVLRDVFSLFWKETYDSPFIGENERVPFVRHDYQREEWVSVGRILVKGYLTCQYLPVLLSQTFLACLFWGESAVTSSMLTQSFRNYISADEKRLIDKCLAGDMEWDDKDEISQLLEVLGSYDCRSNVNSENIVQVIEEIAHKELLQKTQYIADCWKDLVCTLLPSFPDLTALSKRYELLIPSTSKILHCLEANPGSDGERDSLKFLKRYIRGLDTPQKLSKFVRFISGSELMLFDAIQVHFNNIAGLGRRPIAHTCNTVLELSSTYQSFPELREEFSAILTSDYWEMDIV